MAHAPGHFITVSALGPRSRGHGAGSLPRFWGLLGTDEEEEGTPLGSRDGGLCGRSQGLVASRI